MLDQLITYLLVPLFMGLPVLINRLEKRSRVIRWLSPIILCYLIGILLGNLPGFSINSVLMEGLATLAVVLAIPLLLFSSNYSLMLKQARPALLSFFLGVVGVIVCSTCAFLIFRDRSGEADIVAGMMIGVYTGGTFNMSAIGVALGVKEEVFALLNSADIVFSGIYFIFLLTVGKRILGLFLPNYRIKWKNQSAINQEVQVDRPSGRVVTHIVQGILLSLLITLIALGLSFLITGEITEPIVILGITTLGIASSFHLKIRQLPLTFSTANYFLLVFALAMGSLSNFKELLASSSTLFYFCGFVVYGSVLIHFLLAALFRIDRDTLIISSTAAIFGPPFIGPVAHGIGNKDIIAMGITLGLIGYAIGNYLGLGLFYLLH